MNGDEMKRVLDVHAILARAYADDRLSRRAGPCNLRSFVVTTAWVCGIDRPEGNRWERVAELMGIRGDSLWSVFREDAPRYEPLRGTDDSGCEGEMLRRGKPGLCGRRSSTAFRVTDPSDGTWRMAAYCSRHDTEAQAAFRAEHLMCKTRIIPEPDPNVGGLLPCYFKWDWEKWYRQAYPSWKPPRLGIRADDWPAMAKMSPASTPAARLSLIRGDGEDAVPGRPEGVVPLALVRQP
jgi:hypothetical protein